jgi:hypothetical protein
MVCSNSNVTLQAISDGSVEVVTSDPDGAAIVAASGWRCGSLVIANGFISAHVEALAAGIGTGR